MIPLICFRNMTKHTYKTALFLLLCCYGQLFSTKSPESRQPPLFISLGSHCEPSQQLILNNLRSAAFPFDWLLTLNFSGFLSLLQDDSRFLMDRRYLTQDANGVVLNSRYCIDFRHELHDWSDNDFFKHYPEIQRKYERRIRRFKECQYTKGRAYFLRAAFDLNLNPHLPTITKDCTKIERDQALALKNVLQQKFPELDFYLVIINYVEENTADIVGLDRILEFKVRKSHKKEEYTKLFQQLLEHAAK